MHTVHIPVLLHEVIQAFTNKLDNDLFSKNNKDQTSLKEKKIITPSYQQIYLDGTLGGAGHALGIAKAFQGKITIIGLDRDKQAMDRAKISLKDKVQNLILANEDYRNLDIVLKDNNISGVDMILFDLGLSSDELDNSGRGFTFQKDEQLLMTMGDPSKYPFTAKDIVNSWAEEDIANVIFAYGEERFSRRIAKAIINYREKTKIETSFDLAEIIKSSVPGFYRRGKIHPATRSFQALRIAVNDELNALKQGLNKGYEFLNSNGVMAVISFHSLEDRIVKDFYKSKLIEGVFITKKPIIASDQERAENPRSRSAKLRIIQKN